MCRPRASLLILGLLGVSMGCNNATLPTAPVVDTSVPTTLTVLPNSFLGLGVIPCANVSGAMQSYVATLTDVTGVGDTAAGADAGAPFDLPSSPPTPCSQPIAFRYIVSGHKYTTYIDGYELPASELTPIGDPAVGPRTMMQRSDTPVDPADCPVPRQQCTVAPAGCPCSPRWTNTLNPCTPVYASGAAEADVTDCPRLVDSGSSAPTGITVDPRGALGLLACVDLPGGTVVRFDVAPTDKTLPAFFKRPCNSDPGVAAGVVSYTSGVKEGVVYTFAISAFTATGGLSLPAYKTTCSALAQDGLVVAATCEPLVPP